MSNKIKHFYEFADFRLDAENPTLWRGDQLVAISPKALQILVLLVRRKGEIVSREDLLENIWKETFVEEGNINYTISLLRKTLGNRDFIQTVPRRGYRFVAETRETSENEDFSQTASAGISAGVSLPPLSASPLQHPVINPADSSAGKKRPVFVGAAALGILMLTLFVFAWSSKSSDNETHFSAPNSVNRPVNEESLLAYKRGMMILDDRDVENRAQRAVDEFQKAVTLDPTSALAYAGLAEGLVSKATPMTSEKSREFYAKAKIAVEKALALDANLFEAYLVRGWIRRNGDWDWSGAEADFRRAIELRPDNAHAHYRYAHLLSGLGRHPEALAEIKKAYEINPLSETIQTAQTPVLESAGEYEKALKITHEYLQTNSENPPARRALATFQYHLGDYPAVIENGEISLAKNPNRGSFAWLSLLAASYAKIGQQEKADEMLRQLEIQSQTDQKALYALAMNYAELGRLDDAFSVLERCYELREQKMMWVKVEPRFANLKSEPRFQAILEKMRLN